MKIDPNNELCEFACTVCKEKYKETHPQMIDCAWRGIDNEYCPHIVQALKIMRHRKEDDQ
jgi:hypothetical protein